MGAGVCVGGGVLVGGGVVVGMGVYVLVGTGDAVRVEVGVGVLSPPQAASDTTTSIPNNASLNVLMQLALP